MPPAIGGLAATVAGSVAAKLAGGGIIGSIVGAGVSFGVKSLLSSALAPDEGSITGSAGVQQARTALAVNPASSIASIPVIYGTVRIAPTRVFIHATGTDTRHLYAVYAICEGGHSAAPNKDMIDAFSDTRFDDVLSTNSRFSGFHLIREKLGKDNQAADGLFVGALGKLWTNAHRLRGVAYSGIRLTMPNADHEGQQPWTRVPTVTHKIRGRKVYDPRAGGQTTTNPATWEFSDNPALCILDYLTNDRYGKGVPFSEIDLNSFSDAANACDESVSTPAGNAKRYQCDGILDTGRPLLENLDALLTSCRGFLIWSAGKYKLTLDLADATVAHAFTEDNILGSWSYTLGARQARFNRARVAFANEDKNYQPDTQIVSSNDFFQDDGSEILELAMSLPFTTDRYRAQALARIALNTSRDQIAVSFSATLDALNAEAGDIISITHSTPGWSAKLFRVMAIELSGLGDVRVSCVEYDAANYAGTLDTSSGTDDNTDLPDPTQVEQPGAPNVTEELYVTRSGGGVKARAILTWDPSDDMFLDFYEVSYREAPAGAYKTIAPVQRSVTTANVDDLAAGLYDFRVRAINVLDARSEYSTSRFSLTGLSAPPTEPQNFTLSIAGGAVFARWDTLPDLDVTIGGKVEFRHFNGQTGATWETSVSIGEAAPGSGTVAVLPLKAGTYLAKSVDSGGIRSASFASANTKQASLLGFTTLSTVTENPGFSGTKTDTVVTASKLKLVAGGLVDSITLIDDVIDWDAEGGIVPSGTYDFATGIDLTTVKSVRVTTEIGISTVAVNDLIDSRSNPIDEWEDMDGAAGASTDVQVWVRQTDDDPDGSPTWSSFDRLDSGEFSARAFEFQARLFSMDPDYNVLVDTLTATVEEIV